MRAFVYLIIVTLMCLMITSTTEVPTHAGFRHCP
uniref:Hypotheticial protein n=1 Tax=Schistosoma japonicum TaxID=6182 RepID=C1LGS4_SCHJA|nr:hypotheticial protein [Schistosoma japonicum]